MNRWVGVFGKHRTKAAATRAAIVALVIPIAALNTVACTAPYGVRAGAEQRTFANPDEAIAWIQSKADALIAGIEPASAPVGGEARIYVPTRKVLEDVVAKEQESRSDGYPRSMVGLYYNVVPPPFKQRVDLLEISYLVLARAIVQRRIFAKAEILRADQAAPSDAPRGGYVVWIKKRPRENYALVMAASGERDFTDLRLPSNRGDVPGHVRSVEDFAHARRPAAR